MNTLEKIKELLGKIDFYGYAKKRRNNLWENK